jgi:hypothetical protein
MLNAAKPSWAKPPGSGVPEAPEAASATNRDSGVFSSTVPGGVWTPDGSV